MFAALTGRSGHGFADGSASEIGTTVSAVQRRIMGLENEYGVTCTLRGQRRLSPDEVARYLFRRVVSWGRSSNVFLANGRACISTSAAIPEYATPECDSVYDVVCHDRAGERILEQLVASATERLAEEAFNGTIFLFKNNTDSAGNSYGCHENYLTSRADDFSNYAEVLIPFLVTRRSTPVRASCSTPHRAPCTASPSAPSTSGRACRARLRAAARSSTRVTSRTPTPSAFDACMSLSATRT